MFGDGVLTFGECAVAVPLPLAIVQEAVLEFLRDRDDAVLFGAQAVNAYVDEPRMTQDIDVMSTRAEALAEEMRAHLAGRFHIAVRVRKVGSEAAFRLFQIRQPKHRHLVGLRSVPVLPPAQRLAGILVVQPAELIAQKVIAYHRRRGQPKAGTDWRDVAVLLLAFPDLKATKSEVRDRLEAAKADEAVMATSSTSRMTTCRTRTFGGVPTLPGRSERARFSRFTTWRSEHTSLRCGRRTERA